MTSHQVGVRQYPASDYQLPEYSIFFNAVTVDALALIGARPYKATVAMKCNSMDTGTAGGQQEVTVVN